MPITVTDANFQTEVLESETPVLVDFWAAWCGPCLAIAPTIEQLSVEFEGRVKVCKMDVDHNQVTPMNFGIRSIPTLLIFKDGKAVDQVVGNVPKRILSQKLEQVSNVNA